ncbi:MAG: tetratricopeptide repeat protein [Fluviicola sp.]|nr:tetratricopeptide repeat protein [Fluviicola sp.]
MRNVKYYSLVIVGVAYIVLGCQNNKLSERNIDEGKTQTKLYNNENSSSSEMNPILKEAEYLLTAEKYRDAIIKFEISDKEYGQNSISILDKALCYTKLGDYQEALKLNTEYLQIYPNDPMGWSNRGMTYRRLGKSSLALEDFNKSIELDSLEAGLYYNRYFVFVSLGDEKSACEDLSMALKLGFTEKYGSEAEDEFNLSCN